jgi:hypothetical protein
LLLFVGLWEDADEMYDAVGDGTFGDNVKEGAIGGRGGLGVRDSSCCRCCCCSCCEFEFEFEFDDDDDGKLLLLPLLLLLLLLFDDDEVDVVVDIAIDDSRISFSSLMCSCVEKE